MSAKLLVHKIESGLNYKSLQVIIKEDSSETKFSEWLDCRSFAKKKDNEKSPRLVVKIVSGNETSIFNLDSCARLINDKNINVYQNTPINYSRIIETTPEKFQFQSSKAHEKEFANSVYEHVNEDPSEQYNKNIENFPNNQNILSSNTMSPLEYSLEKVKENNARIMENINMLNRALNYTKKKEILDIVLPKSMKTFPCETCGKCFVYETGLKRHCIMRHSLIEARPEWQLVWTCIECFQVWPTYDIVLEHSKKCCLTENVDCVQEIKTSSLLKCEFCEKVFTSIPRLLKHAKTHTTKNNYECISCNKTFISYKAAEEHWLLCEWLITYYNFSLPRLLLCNACDRKFRNYEQLYNHRYKLGHFMSKNNSDCLGTHVFQCEICSDSFYETSQLQIHKGQYHPYHDTSCNIVQNFKEFENN